KKKWDCQFALESSELLIDVLLEDGFLVPTTEQLETLGCATSDSASLTEPRVPQTFLRFWLPLLKMLNSPSFIHLFLEKLFPNGHRCFYISAWISEVLLCNNNKFEYHFETKLQKKARTKDRIFINRIQLRSQQLLSACLDAPCISTPHLIQLVLDDMEHPPPQETREKLFQLCSIYTQTERSEASTPLQQQQPIYTVRMLLDQMQHSRQDARPLHSSPMDSERSEERKWADVQAERALALRGSPWQVCTDNVTWKNYALGKVPGQSDDPSCLMVDNYSIMTVFDQPVELESSATRSSIPGASAPARPAEGLLWSNSELNKLKCGLKLF
uniref:LAS1 like ribosome biosis factor n=1 Tax=Neolamprologus brichardi TaxID=32507 RepID=A0A3Q4M9T3_NEOBR